MKKKGRKVLCLSMWTPPSTRPRAISAGKVISEFVRQGVEPTVVAFDGQGEWDISVPIYRIPRLEIPRIFSPFFITRLFFELPYYKKIYNIVKKIIVTHEPDLVLSFANPQLSNIIGAQIKKKLNVCFFSHFSDPWYDNSYKEYGNFTKKRVLYKEKFVIENSDRVIFTNRRMLNLVMKKYSENQKDKAIVITQGYDPSYYPDVPKTDQKKFVFSYIGVFYKQRNPEVFLCALGKVLKDRKLRAMCEVNFIGSVNPYAGYTLEKLQKLIARYELTDVINIVPMVSYMESLRYMKLSDCLLAIDANFSDSISLPSKIIDYLGSRNVILSITPKGSPTEELMNKLGYKSFTYKDEVGLSEYIRDLLNRKGGKVHDMSKVQEYDIKNVVSKLINSFESVLEEKHR